VDFIAGNLNKLQKLGFERKKSVEASMSFTLDVNGTDFTSNHEMTEVTNTFSRPCAPVQNLLLFN
jgi:hypothetical protein